MTDDLRPGRLAHESHVHLGEERLSGESLFKGRLLHVFRDWVRAPDGHEQSFEYTLHPGAAAMLAMRDDGRLVLERQWRYALNRSFLEVPAGKLNVGEDILQAARRELIEETGFRAERWAYLGVMHPVIGYSTEAIYLFFAQGLQAGPHAREAGECLELVFLTPDELFKEIERGAVSDSKTLSCAYWLTRILSGQYEPKWLDETRPFEI